MKRTNIRRWQVLGLLGLPLAALAVLVLVLSWGNSTTPSAQADAGHAGLQFSLSGKSTLTGTEVCDTNPLTTAILAKCTFSAGGGLVISVKLDSLPTGVATYEGFDALLNFAGPNNTGLASSIHQGPAGKNWPDCGFPANAFSAGTIAAGCGIGINAPASSYTGSLVQVDFTCKPGSITLVHGIGKTALTQSVGNVHAETQDSTEVLTVNCPTATATSTATPTPTPPPVPRMFKEDQGPIFSKPGDVQHVTSDPHGDHTGNVWLTRKSPNLAPQRCVDSVTVPPSGEGNLGSFLADGTNGRLFLEAINIKPTDPDPKGFDEFQIINAFEFEVRYDPKLVCVVIDPFGNIVKQADWLDFNPNKDTVGFDPNKQDYHSDVITYIQSQPANDQANWLCIVQDSSNSQLEGIARVGCVHIGKKKVNPPPAGKEGVAHVLAHIIVMPQPEIFSQVRPNQDNGINAQLLDQGCELADQQGHPIAIFSCEDADVTMRYLEGDVDGPDCRVDVFDAQNIAFRWGVRKGSLLYTSFMDLEPSGQVKGDGDIDIKDLQFVFGRLNSDCNVPQGNQSPVKAKG